MSGIIYQIKPNKFKPTIYGKGHNLPNTVEELKDVHKELAKISGDWLHEIFIDGKSVWQIDESTPFRQ